MVLETNMEMLEDIFKDSYSIITAKSGKEAIEIVKQHETIATVVMDIKMPNGDGIWTFKKLLQLDKTRNIPVIFMTAYPSTVIKNQLLKMGAMDCISKPFIIVDFEHTIATTLGTREFRY